MGLLNGIPWIVGILFLLLINTGTIDSQRRTSRLSNTRTFGINTKSNAPGSEFDCPEEFGYYPHPTDCTQYYVCVFGGALLESCTGGLMYSHELQTCDWPRNVGCEVVDGSLQQQSQSVAPTQTSRDVTPRVLQIKSQQSQQQQQQIPQQTTIGPQRVRYQSPVTTVSPQTLQQIPSVVQQQSQQQQQQSQRTLARQQQISSIPQPEFPAPNPIITSRGQPKSLLESQEEIAKLYAEAHDTLPPAEEEETDRQQRVYRGQPSTLGQVQRDRDGIIHHSNVNAIPTHGKIGSFAFGSQIAQFSIELQDLDDNDKNGDKYLTERKKRDVADKNVTAFLEETTTFVPDIDHELDTDETDVIGAFTGGITADNSSEHARSSRQLRTGKYHSTWQFQPNFHLLPHLTAKSFRSGFSPNIFTPYRTPQEPESSHFYKPNQNIFSSSIKLPLERPLNYESGSSNFNLVPPGFSSSTSNFNSESPNFHSRPSKLTTFNDFKPSTFFGLQSSSAVSESPPAFNTFRQVSNPNGFSHAAVESFNQNQQRPQHQKKNERLPDNYSYFHINQGPTPAQGYETPSPVLSPPHKVTPKGQYIAPSTVGGFYNNNENTDISPKSKKVSHFSIQEPQVTTESNYFAYNILQNKKMREYYATTTTESPLTTTSAVLKSPEKVYSAVSSSGYYPKDILEKLTPPTTVFKFRIPDGKKAVPDKSGFFITQAYTTTKRPFLTTQTKPVAGKKPLLPIPIPAGDFDFEKFVSGIRQSHIAQVDPSIMDTLNFFKQTMIRKNPTQISSTLNPVPFTPSSNSHRFSSTTVRPKHEKKESTASTAVTKRPKGYESFIKSIPKNTNFSFSLVSTQKPTVPPSDGTDDISEPENDDYYYDDDSGGKEYDYDIIPPSEKPPYMPMSETMAPKLPRPTNYSPVMNLKTTKSHSASYTETTTPTYTFSSEISDGDGRKPAKIPSFINFPPDIFQRIPAMTDIREKLKNMTLAQSTTQTLTQTRPTAAASTFMTTDTLTTTSASTSVRTTTVPTTTTRKIYTIRPRTRVNQVWKPKKVTNNLKRPEHQQIRNEEKYKHSTTPQPSNIFVQQPQQQQRQKPVAERQNTRNTYYNTSNQAYDPATYDSFYSVYDDDVELYRDVEYSNQQQQQAQNQYTPSQRGRPQPAVQSTYRPEVVTTPSPQVPVRETYVSKQPPQQTAQQESQDSTYEKPSLSYSSEYDDALISQIDDDQAYNQPARNPPARGDRYDSNSISDSYSSIRTANPSRFAPIFLPTTLPVPTTATTTTTVYKPTTTPSATPSTTTTTTFRPTTMRTTESTTINITTSTTTTTTTTSRPISTTTFAPTSTTSTTTEESTTKSTRSIQSQELGGHTSKSTTANTESIVITLKASTSQRNRNQPAERNHKAPISAKATMNTSSTSTVASNEDIELAKFNSSELQPAYSRANSIPDRVRNVQILSEPPSSDFHDEQSTYSRTLDSLTTTSTEREDTNKTNNDKKISFSLSSGFSTVDGRLRAETQNVPATSEKNSYLGFRVTNAEPQGFRLPEIIASSAHTSSAIVIPEEKLQTNGHFKFSLSSQVGHQNKEKSASEGTAEEVPLPIYSRSRDEGLKRETTRIKVDPTTYAPARTWRHSRTNASPLANDDSNFLNDQFDNKEVDSIYSYRRVRPNDFDLKRNEKEYAPVVEVDRFQGFTTRALTFKDSLNKNSDASGSSRFVSPFKSLETILEEQEDIKPEAIDRNIEPVESTPRIASTEAEPTTSQKPFRSYFIITQPPKLTTTSSTTTTTTEKSTAESNSFISSTSIIATTIAPTTTTTTTTTTPIPIETLKDGQLASSALTFRPIRKQERSGPGSSFRGRSRYTFSYRENNLENDEPTTYSPKIRFFTSSSINSTPLPPKQVKPRFRGFSSRTSSSEGRSRFEFAALRADEPELINTHYYSAVLNETELDTKAADDVSQKEITSTGQVPIEASEDSAQLLSNYQSLGSEKPPVREEGSVSPIQRNVVADQERERFRATVEMPEFNIPTEREIKFASEAQEAQDAYEYQNQDLFGRRPQSESANGSEPRLLYDAETDSTFTTQKPTAFTTYINKRTKIIATTPYAPTRTTPIESSPSPTLESIPLSLPNLDSQELELISTSISTTTVAPRTTTTRKTTTSAYLLPPRASRVNSALKSSIAASSRKKTPSSTFTKCADNSPNAKCNEIPSRTRNRGGVHYNSGSSSQNNEREPSATPATTNRGTHPPRTRPTLKSKGSIVSKAAEFVDIYKNPPTRPEPLYPQPTPDKTAAKCRKDVCLLPDCYCGGKDIPADLPVESLPQIVLLTFDDSVNDLNKQLYTDLFEKGRTNPNGCPITATFYVSHEWTDYSQVQNLYADGHEMASHTVSHSFGEQFSQKKWTREIAGQREILSAYGGVKLSDVRGMRAPFLSIGGNKMFKMLYDSNFTYDSSMPVYENRPPSWPYTLDYKIFHDCMIPPCPTKSYPGVWEVPMVMWQDLNGGRCSMGDACANPADAEGVTKMLMKNFERHYTTNRAPFGLFYHAAWFTQPHHKDGFIKFLDSINAMDDVWIVTNWQMLQWVRDPTPLSRIKQFQPFQCDYSDRPKRCNNPKVCNLWHKSGVRYMRTCQPCPDIYPWTGKTGIRSSRIDNDIEE